MQFVTLLCRSTLMCVPPPLPVFAVTLVHAQQPAAPKPPKPKAYTDPAQTDADFAIQGEYTGQLDDKTFGVQIWAQGGEIRGGEFSGGGCRARDGRVIARR